MKVGYGQGLSWIVLPLRYRIRIAYEANFSDDVAADSPYSGGAGGARRYRTDSRTGDVQSNPNVHGRCRQSFLFISKRPS